MSTPTAADAAQAREIVQHMTDTMSSEESHTAWCERFGTAIAQALADARAEGERRHVEHHRCERCYSAGALAREAS